jgi:hypothetical protein
MQTRTSVGNPEHFRMAVCEIKLGTCMLLGELLNEAGVQQAKLRCQFLHLAVRSSYYVINHLGVQSAANVFREQGAVDYVSAARRLGAAANVLREQSAPGDHGAVSQLGTGGDIDTVDSLGPVGEISDGSLNHPGVLYASFAFTVKRLKEKLSQLSAHVVFPFSKLGDAQLESVADFLLQRGQVLRCQYETTFGIIHHSDTTRVVTRVKSTMRFGSFDSYGSCAEWMIPSLPRQLRSNPIWRDVRMVKE